MCLFYTSNMSEKRGTPKRVSFSDTDQQMSFLPQEGRELNVDGSQKFYRGVVGEDWPDSMPLWLEEKWRRDGVGPYTYHEACKLKEQWLKRHGLVCEELNVNEKQKECFKKEGLNVA